MPRQVKCKMEATEVTASKDKAVMEKQSRDEAEEASEQERRKIPKKARKKAAQKAQNLAAKSSEVEKELEQKSWGSC